MSTRWLVVLVLAFACSKDEAKDSAGKAKEKASSLGGDVKDKMFSVGDDVRAKAKELGADAKSKVGAATDVVGNAADQVVDTAGSVATSVADTATGALATGKRVKAELDKVYKTTHDYDIAVDEVGTSTPAGEAHAKQLDAMPSVKVGDATVGYTEDLARSVGGVTRSKHFRASWRRGDKIVRVSFFTSERIDAVAFAALLRELVPIVERVL
jgi:hypothetical protein